MSSVAEGERAKKGKGNEHYEMETNDSETYFITMKQRKHEQRATKEAHTKKGKIRKVTKKTTTTTNKIYVVN